MRFQNKTSRQNFWRRQGRRRNHLSVAAAADGLEPRVVLSATPMAIGMNLDNVRDYMPNWMFTDVFQQSRPWISHEFNTVTGQTNFNGSAFPVSVDEGSGWPTRLNTRINEAGQLLQQRLGTLMFNSLSGNYPGGEYRVEWDGMDDLSFGFDARETARGTTPDGHHFALLNVVPGNNGIYLRINSMSEADPIRDIRVWMPDYTDASGVTHSFAGQRWEPGAAFSPFHPLFKERLDDFGILRFMQPMETNTSDVRTWNDRRDTDDARQNSGLRGPMANGMAVEYMVQLANELDADPWFNMPHMADDTYVRNFATYVRDNLEPGRTAYVEWSNEVWNTAPGYEVAPWITEQIRLPENSGLTTWQFIGREIRRDMDVWSNVFAGQTGRIVRTVGGQAVNSWVVERILENLGGSFDAVAIAPYFGPSTSQLATYTADTTPAQILDDLRSNLPFGVQATLRHQQIADDYSRALNRDIRLLAYEGGPGLIANSGVYQTAFLQAAEDPGMADVMSDYLRMQNAAGLDAYVHYKFTRPAGLRPTDGYWGTLTAQDQPLSTAHVYRTLLEADAGPLFTSGPTLVTVNAADPIATEQGRSSAAFRFTRGGNLSQPLSVSYSVGGTATPGNDFVPMSGVVNFPANQNTVYVFLSPVDDAVIELNESVIITLNPGGNYSLVGGTTNTASISIISNDLVAGAPTVSIAATDATAFETNRDPGVFTVTRANGDLTRPLTVWLQFGQGTATASDVDAIPLRVDFAANQTSANIIVRPVDDAIIENRETVVLTINTNSVNYAVGNRTATVSILDNDGVPASLPVVTLAVTDATASEDGRETGTFTVTRAGATTSPLTVAYAIEGTATNGFDYDRLPGLVTIPAGASSATITVRPIDERVVDAGETISLRLNGTPTYIIGAQNVGGLTITDNDAPLPVPVQPVLMVIANRDFYYREYSEPRWALEAAGIPVIVGAGSLGMAIPHSGTGYGDGDGAVRVDVTLTAANATDYSAIVFVGGWGASSYQFARPFAYSNASYEGSPAVRNAVNELVNDFVEQDKYVTGVCFGVSVLAWSRVNGQSLLNDRMATTAHFNSPTNNGGFGLYRQHLEVNGASAFTGGELGTPVSRDDDVIVDGKIITAENFDSAALLGRTLAAYLINGASTTTVGFGTEFTSVSEDAAPPALLSVIRSGLVEHAQVIRVNHSGSATEHADFLSFPRRILFQPRQTMAAISITPVNDTIDEDDEDLFFELLGDPSYQLSPLQNAIVRILDND